MSAPQRVPAERLEQFTRECLEAVGLPGDDAACVAALMADADVNGSDGHGIFRLPQYVERILNGGINVTPDIKPIRESPSACLVDGDNAMGHLVMSYAASVAIDKARTAGVGWVGARNSNHAGPAALYAKMPLAHDMIGLYIAVGNANHLPPWGGIDMLLSTNPIAVAVPANEHPPIVLDMATTVAAYGKVKTAVQRGQTMPEGWMIDRQGQPLTDPARADEGFLLPIGGAKGYGLALIFGLLAGTLNGAAFGKDVIDFNADSVTPTNTGQLIVAISIAAFADIATFKRCVDAAIEQMHGSERLPGIEAIRVPGERSHAVRSEREALGVPVHQGLLAALRRLGSALDVVPPL
jgi:L-2-hydroxycarboxylate dehydrogenase (NAD+)